MSFLTKKPEIWERGLTGKIKKLSIHFRGPIHLKQFAVYIPHSGVQKFKKKRRDIATTKGDKEKNEIVDRGLEKRAMKTVTVWETETVKTIEYVTVTAEAGVMDGGCVMPTSFLSSCTTIESNISSTAVQPKLIPFPSGVVTVSTFRKPTATTSDARSAAFTPLIPGVNLPTNAGMPSIPSAQPVVSSTPVVTSISSVEPVVSSTSSTPTALSQINLPALGDFQRIGFYNAEAQHSEGITFLGNFGAEGISGTWST